MATFENVGLALQLVNNIHGLVANMRDNAGSQTGYKSQIAGGWSPETLATIMVEDANRYLERIKLVTDTVTANQAGVSAALQALALTLSEANSLKTLLSGVANHTKAADLSTAAAINAEADYILATVPNWQRIF